MFTREVRQNAGIAAAYGDPTLDSLETKETIMFAELATPLARVWQGQKQRSSRTASAKNTPGTDYPTKITHRQDADFNEIHTDANGDFFLYNVKTDAWDIKGDSADLPYYADGLGHTWAYNVRSGAWDVRVMFEDFEFSDEPTPSA